MYFPTLTPGWSETLVGSSTNTLSSASADTSYLLPASLKKSCAVGMLA
jgi:hypothetical protein